MGRLVTEGAVVGLVAAAVSRCFSSICARSGVQLSGEDGASRLTSAPSATLGWQRDKLVVRERNSGAVERPPQLDHRHPRRDTQLVAGTGEVHDRRGVERMQRPLYGI